MGILVGAIMVIVGIFMLGIPVIGWFMGTFLIIIGIMSFFGDILGFLLSIIVGFFSFIFNLFFSKENEINDEYYENIDYTQTSKADELTKLSVLLKENLLTEEEFEKEKQNILRN